MTNSFESDELRCLQLIELDILKTVDECCKQFGIKYFLTYGTALGAVRHHGFIPWDDDIDIGMPRIDYDNFIHRGGVHDFLNKRGCYIQHFTLNEKTPFCYAKICKAGTEFIEYAKKDLDIPQGIFIDLFPYDNIASEKEVYEKQHDDVLKWSRFFVFRQIANVSAPPTSFTGKMRAVLRHILFWGMHIVPAKVIYKKVNNALQRFDYNDTGTYGNLFYPKRNAGYLNQSMIDNLQEVEFEGAKFPVPANVDQYLRSIYGDWNSLPPVEKRIGHRPYRLSYIEGDKK